jgi:hypothetical protein
MKVYFRNSGLIEKYIPQEMEEHKNGKRINFRVTG